jgi:hypothetical protein
MSVQVQFSQTRWLAGSRVRNDKWRNIRSSPTQTFLETPGDNPIFYGLAPILREFWAVKPLLLQSAKSRAASSRPGLRFEPGRNSVLSDQSRILLVLLLAGDRCDLFCR